MEREKPNGVGERTLRASRRAVRYAERQGGRLTREQLLACGLARGQITTWLRNGRLHRVSDGVYALGHATVTEETPLIEALLRAGSGSALTGGTNLWWRDLIRFPPRQIHVSTPSRCRSAEGVVIHHPKETIREWHRGLPVAPVADALLLSALEVSFGGLRRAIALIDKKGLMSLEELARLGRSRRRGAKVVREAFANHMPELAETRSDLEDQFLFFCESHEIELPRPNQMVAGYEVDAVWPHLKLAVELDGREEHGKPAAVIVDRRRELAVRGAGFEVLRYGSEQLTRQSKSTAQDLRAAIERGRTRVPPGSSIEP